jgi:hypothetical protein
LTGRLFVEPFAAQSLVREGDASIGPGLDDQPLPFIPRFDRGRMNLRETQGAAYLRGAEMVNANNLLHEGRRLGLASVSPHPAYPDHLLVAVIPLERTGIWEDHSLALHFETPLHDIVPDTEDEVEAVKHVIAQAAIEAREIQIEPQSEPAGLSATANDAEALEQIYRSLAFESQENPKHPGDPNSCLWREARPPISLREIGDAIQSLVARGLLVPRWDPLEESKTDDSSSVWRAWFEVSEKGRSLWAAMADPSSQTALTPR